MISTLLNKIRSCIGTKREKKVTRIDVIQPPIPRNKYTQTTYNNLPRNKKKKGTTLHRNETRIVQRKSDFTIDIVGFVGWWTDGVM